MVTGAAKPPLEAGCGLFRAGIPDAVFGVRIEAI